MRVFDQRTEHGLLHSFEVENIWLGRRAAARVVRSIPGVRVIRAEASWWARDDFCEFDLNGARFIIEEPFGDNSRYWIGPVEAGHQAELAVVRQTFLDIRRPEWISGRLFTAAILLFSGATSLGRMVVRPSLTSCGWLVEALAAGAIVAGVALAVSWGLAVNRGHYQSRPIEEFPITRKAG